MNYSLKIKLLELTQRALMVRADAQPDNGDKWRTTETGSKILLGKDGTVKGGMGGKFNGKNIKEVGGTKKFTKYQTNKEREQGNEPTAKREPPKPVYQWGATTRPTDMTDKKERQIKDDELQKLRDEFKGKDPQWELSELKRRLKNTELYPDKYEIQRSGEVYKERIDELKDNEPKWDDAIKHLREIKENPTKPIVNHEDIKNKSSITFEIASNGDVITRTLSKGDYVQPSRLTAGIIEGISNAKQQVKVNGLWHDIKTVTPAEAPEKFITKKELLPKVIKSNNKKTGKGIEWTDDDKVPLYGKQPTEPANLVEANEDVKKYLIDRYSKELTSKGLTGKEHAEKLKAGFDFDKIKDYQWENFRKDMEEQPKIDAKDAKVKRIGDEMIDIINKHGAESEEARNKFESLSLNDEVMSDLKNYINNRVDIFARKPTEPAKPSQVEKR